MAEVGDWNIRAPIIVIVVNICKLAIKESMRLILSYTGLPVFGNIFSILISNILYGKVLGHFESLHKSPAPG